MHSVMKSEKRTTCFELEWFEKYRTELMGIAAIGIILCHANATGVMLPSIIRKIFSFGTECVDLFLMLSGIGIYYSLSKKDFFKTMVFETLSSYRCSLFIDFSTILYMVCDK